MSDVEGYAWLEIVAINCQSQGQKRASALPSHVWQKNAMPYEQERVSSAFQAVMKRKELNPHSWAKKASGEPGVGEISHNTINNIVNGTTRAPRIDTLYRLADAAGVPLWELIGEDVPWKGEATELRRQLAEIRDLDRTKRQILDRALNDKGIEDA